MNKTSLFILLVFASACSINVKTDGLPPKMVPDHTPYIAGLIEASPDTTHHYPEIVVGYFTDIYTNERDPHFPGLLQDYPGIYNPTLLRQVVQTSILYGLKYQPESDATVAVRGPLRSPNEKKVTFTSEGNGVYGDKDHALSRMADKNYQLQVTLPNGNKYEAQTHIPKAVNLQLKDSVSIDVEYKPFGDGTPKEEDMGKYSIIFNPSPDGFQTVVQFNSDKDREFLLLKPNEHFRFTDRSNYLRTGIGYQIRFTHSRQDTFSRPWVQNLDKPRKKIWSKEHWWLRFSYFSKGIGKNFFQLETFFTAGKRWLKKINSAQSNAASNNDSTYLFRTSTIRNVGKHNNILPKDSSDAIGFFGGYFSRYKQFTLYANRHFDLDSVITAWHDKD